MKSLIDKFIWYLILVMLGGVLVLLSMLLFESPQVEFANIPFPVDKYVYEPNEEINVQIEECSDEKVDYRYNSFLVNVDTGESILTGVINRTSTGEGCQIINPISVVVPDNAQQGHSFLLFNVISEGVFRSFSYNTAETGVFEITSNQE